MSMTRESVELFRCEYFGEEELGSEYVFGNVRRQSGNLREQFLGQEKAAGFQCPQN